MNILKFSKLQCVFAAILFTAVLINRSIILQNMIFKQKSVFVLTVEMFIIRSKKNAGDDDDDL